MQTGCTLTATLEVLSDKSSVFSVPTENDVRAWRIKWQGLTILEIPSALRKHFICNVSQLIPVGRFHSQRKRCHIGNSQKLTDTTTIAITSLKQLNVTALQHRMHRIGYA